MGKRKSRKYKPRPLGSLKPPEGGRLPHVFDCPFCNTHKAVHCRAKNGVGEAECSSCREQFKMAVSSLDEPIDVYHQWIDELEQQAEEDVAKRQAPPPGGGSDPDPILPAGLVLSPPVVGTAKQEKEEDAAGPADHPQAAAPDLAQSPSHEAAGPSSAPCLGSSQRGGQAGDVPERKNMRFILKLPVKAPASQVQ